MNPDLEGSPQDVEIEETRYIVYRIGDASFASPLLTITEIVDPLPYCYVPNEHEYFLGLANLRGQIIGVIDLGLRFGMASSNEKEAGVLLIFEHDGATLGALVSGVESAISLRPEEIVNEEPVSHAVPEEAYIGVARMTDRILPIISLVRLVHIVGPSLNYGS